MSLYYNNFKYLDVNSIDRGLIVSAFEPDDGFTESFLSMEPVQEDYYDGTKKFDYGARYNQTAVINITVIKSNGTDFNLDDVCLLSRWLTGSRINSWLDVGPSKDDIKYSFLGRVTDLKPRKLDGRTIGFQIEFSSVSPWAYSAEQHFSHAIEQVLYIDDGALDTKATDSSLSVDENGVLYHDSNYKNDYFSIIDDNIAEIDNAVIIQTDNQTDDLYTYIYLDMDYTNENSEHLSIKNITLDEETTLSGMSANERVFLSAKQFITSSIPNKIFGDDFNFVWPRLAPGVNEFLISATAEGSMEFSYRYPMKIGDCAMDITTYGGGIDCGDCDEMSRYDTIKWEQITDIPTSIGGYGITDVYTKAEVDDRIENIDVEWEDVANTPTTISGYGIADAYTKVEVDDKIDNIEVSGDTSGGNYNIDEEELNKMLDDVLE